MTTEIAHAPAPAFDLTPKSFEQALQLADYLAESSMVPKDFIGKPGNCLIAMQWGMEVGLKPLQALQGIAVINGRPALWGDSLIALVRASSVCEYVKETDDGKTATCTVKRRGSAEESRTFSMDDAQKAGLIGKAGPWTQYPKRMRQMRARGFALRDVFPDVLKGMAVAEELMDYPKDMGDAIPAGGLGSEWDPEALEAAQAAASKGAAAYGAFWKALAPEEQSRLVKTPEHAANKASALKADSARTIDTGSAAPTTEGAQPAVTFAKVMQRLIAAKTLDELDDAADWIGEVADEMQRNELTAKYKALGAEMEAAQ